jgi:LysR family transcriptional regulator, transcriptional activator of nhaA
MRWLNYQHLFYFWHVARNGSVTGASQVLRLAQPTISAQIKSFEEVLGEDLFERDGRNLKMTEAGKIAFSYAEKIFSLGQEFLDVLDGKFETKAKEIKIGISDVVPKSLAYKLIEPAFDPKWTANVFCYEDKTERLLAELSIGEIDLVLADRPIPLNVKVKAFNHFIGESSVSLLATTKMAKLYKKNFPASLTNAPLLLPTSETAVRFEIDQWLERKGITPHCVGSFQDRALMKLAAREGKGILPIPTVVQADVCREFNLTLVGEITEVKEHLYLISIDKRIKNPIVFQICAEAQKTIYSRNQITK